ncbi:MAG: hypothetical protein NVSMB48_13120 [Marmoricola sp.]
MTNETPAHPGNNGGPAAPIQISVDGEPVVVPRDTTPDAILRADGLDPATHYLVRVEGHHQTSYQGKGSEQIEVHHGEVFVSLSTGPTPTS